MFLIVKKMFLCYFWKKNCVGIIVKIKFRVGDGFEN